MDGHPPANLDAEISTDAAGLGVGRVGLTQHHSAHLDDVEALPHLAG